MVDFMAYEFRFSKYILKVKKRKKRKGLVSCPISPEKT